ncbi:MAG: hypothetical protein ACK5UQ_23255 [Planctomycetota bacterium]
MAQDAAIVLKKLAERVLAKNGDVPLAQLLELLVPVRRLRDLARDLGLTPKGGFRVDKAPAHVLAPLLADVREPEPLDRILRALVPAADDGDDAELATAVDPAVLAEARQLLSLRESESARLRDEIERAREALARAQEREREQGRRAERLEHELALLRRDRGSRVEPVREAPSRDDKELLRRLHDLENEREGFVAADAALRRQAAFDQSRLRDLEQTVRELEGLLPKGKRRRKPAPPEPPPPQHRFLLPRFTAAFYKSLDGKEPRAVERAIQAVLLFCTEGHGYPGLEVKQLGGQDTWSLRASLGLRVYFRQGDGEIELLELGDREDQNTTLRRLKER